MKKIYYFIIAGLMTATTAVAQQSSIVKAPGFESQYYPGSAIGVTSPNVGAYVVPNTTSLAWLAVGGNETTSPITDTQSAFAKSVDDSVANANLFGFPSDSVTGLIEQSYEGDFKGLTDSITAQNIEFNYSYTYAPMTGDTAMVRVLLMDTNITAQNGVLYVGVSLIGDATTGTTQSSISTWQQVQNGTPNKMLIDFASSYTNLLSQGQVPALAGSKLTVDDLSFVINLAGGNNAGIISNTKPSAMVYPNPASNVLNIKVNNAQASSVSIYGIDGTLIKTVSINGTNGQINVSNLSNGMYFYKVITQNGGVIQSKFIKK